MCGGNVGGIFGYMPPESFSEGPEPSKEVDMYAFGIVVYGVVTGPHPFGQRWSAWLPLPTTVGAGPDRPNDPVAVGFGQGTWEFVEKCWDGDLQRRPTAREALEHFQHVAKTSMVVDPGPTILDHGAADEVPSKSDSSSKSRCGCCGHFTFNSPL